MSSLVTFEICITCLFLVINIPFIWKRTQGNWRLALDQFLTVYCLLALVFSFVDAVIAFGNGGLFHHTLPYPILFLLSMPVQILMLCNRITYWEINGYGPQVNDAQFKAKNSKIYAIFYYAFCTSRVASSFGVPFIMDEKVNGITSWFTVIYFIKIFQVIYLDAKQDTVMFVVRQLIYFYHYYLMTESVALTCTFFFLCFGIMKFIDIFGERMGQENSNLVAKFQLALIFAFQNAYYKYLLPA